MPYAHVQGVFSGGLSVRGSKPEPSSIRPPPTGEGGAACSSGLKESACGTTSGPGASDTRPPRPLLARQDKGSREHPPTLSQAECAGAPEWAAERLRLARASLSRARRLPPRRLGRAPRRRGGADRRSPRGARSRVQRALLRRRGADARFLQGMARCGASRGDGGDALLQARFTCRTRIACFGPCLHGNRPGSTPPPCPSLKCCLGTSLLPRVAPSFFAGPSCRLVVFRGPTSAPQARGFSPR